MNQGTPAQIPTQQHIKSMHLKQIFLSALHSGGISRAQLKQEMHLSFPSVSSLTDELLSRGILFETDLKASPERGRPRTLLQVNPKALAIPVASMTREGYQYALFDCCAQRLSEGFLPFPPPSAAASPHRYRDAEALCAPLRQWIAAIAPMYRLSDLILSAPGTCNTAGVFSSSALRIITPPNFLQLLSRETGLHVILENNSDCDAYTEHLLQELPEDFTFIHIGDGVGAGILRKGKIFRSGSFRAGEIGHISIDYRGRPCSCGGKGCLEQYISTSVLAADVSAFLGETTDFDRVCELYRQEAPEIVALVNEKAPLLAIGISNMLAMQPVSHVVLGGGIEKLGEPFLKAVQDAVRTTGIRKRMEQVRITFTQNRTGSGILGAVWNYLDHQLQIEVMF